MQKTSRQTQIYQFSLSNWFVSSLNIGESHAVTSDCDGSRDRFYVDTRANHELCSVYTVHRKNLNSKKAKKVERKSEKKKQCACNSKRVARFRVSFSSFFVCLFARLRSRCVSSQCPSETSGESQRIQHTENTE